VGVVVVGVVGTLVVVFDFVEYNVDLLVFDLIVMMFVVKVVVKPVGVV